MSKLWTKYENPLEKRVQLIRAATNKKISVSECLSKKNKLYPAQ